MRKVLLGLSVVLALVVLVGSVSATVPPIPVYVDIKPESWPNPLRLGDGPMPAQGVLPVAILGTVEFDVATIDPETIMLTRETLGGIGVSPLRWSYEDVATPRNSMLDNGMEDLGPDGYMDLSLKFKTQEVIDTLRLGDFSDRDVIMLIISGHLRSDTPIHGEDCIIILTPKVG